MSARLRALRGATTLYRYEREHVIERTAEMVLTLLERGGLTEDDLVSMVFTATADVTSVFPAEAAREVGITHVPLLCDLEIDVAGAIPRCVRVLVHAHTSRARDDLRHVYLHGARQLRTDLPE